ncbi:tetratricopeptide repeat protein [Sorangium sp. So ce834]|uniref:tetratricopeptide repeat protein n=1 Tax=Sorangium sp. So ce834 TaxID=3133321 RepID=UPI003F60EB4F
MSNAPETWTQKGFLSHFDFVHTKMKDHAFAWVLGAGASKPSGIPTGGELVERWLRELHERLDRSGSSLRDWATAERLGIDKFNYSDAASFYPRVYERRFRNNPEEGYACLEDLMIGVEPSPGYSILAKTMEDTRHKVVITTNFDNLVADALAIYTTSYPLVVGHESLAAFVRAAVRRPLVCKIHRDLLLGPKNDPRSMRRLHESWAATLRELFVYYTPIVIGYGGNDDSLMNLLGSLEPGEIKGQMIWCYYEKSTPSDRIREVVAQHRGVLVPVPDFDVLMLLIGAKMNIEPLDQVLGERAKLREEKYWNRILQLNPIECPDLIPALSSAYTRANVGWWTWELKARTAVNVDETDKAYRDGIQEYPECAELYRNYAAFMNRERHNAAEAERLYRCALGIAPDDVGILGEFAPFIHIVKKSPGEAEELYRRALAIDPDDVDVLTKYAIFMQRERKNDEEAERLYRRALDVEPTNVRLLSNCANFMQFVRKNLVDAEMLYRRALDVDPDNVGLLVRYAKFMRRERRNAAEAERLYRRALELKPDSVEVLLSYASLMRQERKNIEEAERLYRRALELKPDDVDVLLNYASLMRQERKNIEEAERLYRRALELKPDSVEVLLSYASLMRQERKNVEEAERLYRRALELKPNSAPLLASYATFLYKSQRKSSDAEDIFCRATELDPRNAAVLAQYAIFVQSERRDVEKAEALYRRALEFGSDNASILSACAYFMFRVQKNAAEAEKLYRRALELEPEDVSALSGYADLLQDSKRDVDEAEVLFRKAVELKPDDVVALVRFAQFLYLERKDIGGAEKLYRRALELEPENVSALSDYASLLQDSKRGVGEAESLFRKAVELKPDDVVVLDRLARLLYLERKNIDEAETLYRHALELEPDNANLHANYIGFLVSQGRLSECEGLVERALLLNNWSVNPITGEILLYAGVIERCAGSDDTGSLGRLKTLFEYGYRRGRWSFDAVLEVVRSKLSKDEAALYETLAAAVLDEKRTKDLNGFERWQSITPLPLGASRVH